MKAYNVEIKIRFFTDGLSDAVKHAEKIVGSAELAAPVDLLRDGVFYHCTAYTFSTDGGKGEGTMYFKQVEPKPIAVDTSDKAAGRPWSSR